MEITTNWVAKRIEKNFTVMETGSPRDFSSGSASKESTCPCRRYRRCRFDPWVRRSPWSRKWQPILVFLPGESHGQRSPEGYSPWGRKESDMTEWLTRSFTFIEVRRNQEEAAREMQERDQWGNRKMKRVWHLRNQVKKRLSSRSGWWTVSRRLRDQAQGALTFTFSSTEVFDDLYKLSLGGELGLKNELKLTWGRTKFGNKIVWSLCCSEEKRSQAVAGEGSALKRRFSWQEKYDKKDE